jgi:hypothetical protein
MAGLASARAAELGLAVEAVTVVAEAVAQAEGTVALGDAAVAVAVCGGESAPAAAMAVPHGEAAPVAPDAAEPPMKPSGDSSSEAPKAARPSMRLKAINVLGYESEEQIQRHKALMRMGLCEDDIYLSAPYFRPHDKMERLRQLYARRGYSEKLLDLLGMTEEQILRRKALLLLGTTEQEVEEDRVRRLVALGIQFSPRRQPPAENTCLNK